MQKFICFTFYYILYQYTEPFVLLVPVMNLPLDVYLQQLATYQFKFFYHQLFSTISSKKVGKHTKNYHLVLFLCLGATVIIQMINLKFCSSYSYNVCGLICAHFAFIASQLCILYVSIMHMCDDCIYLVIYTCTFVCEYVQVYQRKLSIDSKNKRSFNSRYLEPVDFNASSLRISNPEQTIQQLHFLIILYCLIAPYLCIKYKMLCCHTATIISYQLHAASYCLDK